MYTHIGKKTSAGEDGNKRVENVQLQQPLGPWGVQRAINKKTVFVIFIFNCEYEFANLLLL